MDNLESSKYLIIEKEVLPDIFEKVLLAKELLMIGEYKEVTEAVKEVGISRSSFYKYRDKVFRFSEKNVSKKVIMNFMLNHRQGVLAYLIKTLSSFGGNILTINQEIPINGIASVNITFEIQSLSRNLDKMTSELKKIDGVSQASIIAME
ncbi:MAG: ACT domain-containing protein [Andreesenia angusta]|nr:ACT domain-containing protein [Andreesenia angusta]